MKIEVFRADDRPTVMRRVLEVLGDDAVILKSRALPGGGLEVAAAAPGQVQALKRQLDGDDGARTAPARIRPRVVALVGPAGGGKTTAMMKLALHARGFGSSRVGIITLDTYRIGALDEVRSFAEVTGIPLQVAHGDADGEKAIRRLRERQVILVDTPGRLSPSEPGVPEWVRTLRALDPDEVHLVCPAGLRATVAGRIRWGFERCKPTHLLLSRTDEVFGDPEVLTLVRAVGLAARWSFGDHHVPGHLAPALPGIVNSLEVPSGSDGKAQAYVRPPAASRRIAGLS